MQAAKVYSYNGVTTTVSPCADTATTYPETKVPTTSCSLIFDAPNMKAWPQYTVHYTDPVAGDVQVAGCTEYTDPTKAVTMTTTTIGCGYQNDFTKGISTEESKIIYTWNGTANQVYQDCTPDGVTYPQTKTDAGCTPVIAPDNSTVTLSYKTQITVNGTAIDVNPCTPDTVSTPVQTENCTTQPYTNDFIGGMSYLNKNYFYMDGTTRVNVLMCSPSTTSFVQKQDESGCTATSNDSTMQTTLYAQTYIENPVGTKIYLTNCASVSPPVSYTANGGVWKIASSSPSSLDLSAADLTSIHGINPITDTMSQYESTAVWPIYIANYVEPFPVCNDYNSNLGKRICLIQPLLIRTPP